MQGPQIFHHLNSFTFQDLVADLFNAKENTNTYTALGRSGQKQNGIDIISTEKATVIQCKYKNNLNTETDIKRSLIQNLKKDVEQASQSGINFDHFILVSTYRHDAEIQYTAIALRDENDYPFQISYIGWDEIQKWIIQFPNIQSRYFKSFSLPKPLIEFVNVEIDSERCSWEAFEGYENAFYQNNSNKSQFPIFDFRFINHLDRTIILKSIHLWVKSLYSGLTGIPRSSPLDSSHTYQMKFKKGKENILTTNPPLEIPADQAFRFKLHTIHEYEGQAIEIDDRNMLYFNFVFSSNISITLPKIYLNTKDELNSISIQISL